MRIYEILKEELSAPTKFTCLEVAEDILGKNNISTDMQNIKPNQFLIEPVDIGDAKYISPKTIAASPYAFPGGKVKARNLAAFTRRTADDNKPNPSFKDQEWYKPLSYLGTIQVPIHSRNAADVGATAHECYHAWMWVRTYKSNGQVYANEKIVNQQAEKWLREHLSGIQLHAALEVITHSRISYGHNK